MSEGIAGLDAPPVEPPRDAAVVLLWRPGPSGGREIFWLRRGAGLAFGGGMYAFPGGKLDRADAEIPVEGASGEAASFRACAARELFEEAGVLLAEGADGLAAADRAGLRQRLLHGRLGFGELLATHGLRLRAGDLAPAGRWISPPFVLRGFDARFFLARMPEGQVASISEEDGSAGRQAEAEGRSIRSPEASEGGFTAPADALARWREGRALLHPPTLNALRAIAVPGWDDALRMLREPELVVDHVAQWLEFQEGVVLVPQRTPTLPPATHTNCYLLGLSEVLLVDPGADDPAELELLFARLRDLGARGRRPVAIFLTHHHRDHVGGLSAVARRLGLPVWAHRHTADRLEVPCARLVDDGEELDLPGFPLQAVHTPGHTRGHLVLLHPPSRAVVAGDLVSSLSTIVIDPPEGDMAQYLASLRRVADLPCGTLFPAHGPPIADGPGKLREYLEHRQAREALVLAALRAGAGTPEAIVAQAYQDTPLPLHPIAERQALAHLTKLAAEGLARRLPGERWAAAASEGDYRS